MGLRQQVEHCKNAAKPVTNVTNQTLHEDLNVPYIT
jgi:hypothetical protein